jgi:DNA (cytosine-5)-methyltransferase 1
MVEKGNFVNGILNFLDLFAGGGGLSEGFIRAGFKPIAHVEMDQDACYTLKTRAGKHWLTENDSDEIYYKYLSNEITRDQFYEKIPGNILSSIINAEIGEKTLPDIFLKIDELSNNNKINLIIGGPPCQAYSFIGRSRDVNRMVGDKRNYLYKYYAKFLERYKPDYFVFENVSGILSARDESNNLYYDDMVKIFKEFGYYTEQKIISAENYGVLQNRKRVIIIGKRGNKEFNYPEPEEWHPFVLVKHLFSDLPSLKQGTGNIGPCEIKKYEGKYLYKAGIRNDLFPVTYHQARPQTKQDLKIYQKVVELWNKKKMRLDYNSLPDYLKTHQNRESFTDRFKVVAGDLRYSHTVVAHIAKDGHYYIHPDINQNRSITPREAARLQSFPDDYYFETASGTPGRSAAFRQIGNAVPVLMAEKIAKKLLEVWQ